MDNDQSVLFLIERTPFGSALPGSSQKKASNSLQSLLMFATKFSLSLCFRYLLLSAFPVDPRVENRGQGP